MSIQVRNETPMQASWHAIREHKTWRVVLISLQWPLKNVQENVVQGLGPQFIAMKFVAVSETNKQMNK